MTRNKLTDLNDHLFAALERLGDEELTGEALQEEITRSRVIASVSGQIIANGNLVLDAARFTDDHLDASRSLPPMLGGAS